jgi:hypothetical protein
MSIDEDFSAPAAAKGLSEEVKAIKGWLGASELFGSPQMLLEPPQSNANLSETVPLAVEMAEEVVVPEEAKEVNQAVVSPSPCFIHLDLLTPL